MNRPPPPSDNARQALAAYRAGVSAAKRRDIEKAIRHLRKTGAAINVAAVAARAGVQRKTIYKHPDLIAAIDQYRRRTPTSDTDTDTAQGGRTNTIIDALRKQLATKDNEISALRQQLAEHAATIALLYGELDRATNL
ncbi:transposase [Mycobacteroides chelonae]|nr:transposase [Mycobacteroides chelonae]